LSPARQCGLWCVSKFRELIEAALLHPAMDKGYLIQNTEINEL
jgi:hypothetical protein